MNSIKKVLTFAVFIAVFLSGPTVAQAQDTLKLPLQCFDAFAFDLAPPPAATPCHEPVGMPDEFKTGPYTGEMKLWKDGDGNTVMDITLKDINPDLVLTAWVSHTFPNPPPTCDGCEILTTEIDGRGVSPAAPITAGFTGGIGPDPNQFTCNPGGKCRLKVNLGFNLLAGGAAPLTNATEHDQGSNTDLPGYPGLQAPDCCGHDIPQQVTTSWLRQYDEFGFQVLDENGLPVVLRSPIPPASIVVVAHIDKITHGVSSGLGILPVPGFLWESGDHWFIGAFDLRPFQE